MEKIRMTDVISLLGLPMPSGGRSSFYVQCPCCDDSPRNRHLNVNLKKEVFRCPKCGVHGGMFDLYSLFTGIPRDKARKAIMDKVFPSDMPVIRKKDTVPKPTTVECSLSDIEVRHATYTALLSLLSLANDHITNLKNRGISDDDIKKFGYKSTPVFGMNSIASQLLDKGFTLAGVPGFYTDENEHWTFISEQRGILIPVRDRYGRIQGLQIRRDNAEKRKFRWVSSVERKSGCGSSGWVHIAGPIRPTMLLTEGPMKADVIYALSGLSVIAVPGVNALKTLTPVLEDLKSDGFTTIKTAFDMDLLSNFHVKDGYNSLLQLLNDLDFQFGTYLWNPYYKGLDDYIYHIFKENQNP